MATLIRWFSFQGGWTKYCTYRLVWFSRIPERTAILYKLEHLAQEVSHLPIKWVPKAVGLFVSLGNAFSFRNNVATQVRLLGQSAKAFKNTQSGRHTVNLH